MWSVWHELETVFHLLLSHVSCLAAALLVVPMIADIGPNATAILFTTIGLGFFGFVLWLMDRS